MQRGGCHPEDGCYEPWGEDGYPVRTSRGSPPMWWTRHRPDDPARHHDQEGPGVKVGYIGMTLEATP